MLDVPVNMQAHIPILETTPEGRAALLAGLQYLTNISFVDDEEVRCMARCVASSQMPS